jgi:hypothetical protein
MLYYPENTVAHYITRLPDAIRLTGSDYEVGLAEIMFPISWYNISNEYGKLYVEIERKKDGERVICLVDSGYYPDGKIFANRLMMKIREVIDPTECSVGFFFDATTKKFSLKIKCSNDVIFKLSKEFAKKFGFSKQGPYVSGLYWSVGAVDIHQNKNLLYVYCDVVAHSNVGHIKAPLLRVCNIKGDYGEMIRITYTHPHYIPVSRREFDTIEINLNDELGRPFSFLNGKSVVILHFRRRNSLLAAS